MTPIEKVVLDIDVSLFDFDTDFNMQNHLVFTLGFNHLKYNGYVHYRYMTKNFSIGVLGSFGSKKAIYKKNS